MVSAIQGEALWLFVASGYEPTTIEQIAEAAEVSPRSMFLTRGRLILSVPALRARLWGFLQENEVALCRVFAAQSGRDPQDFELRVAAGAIMGGPMAALTEWVRSDGQSDIGGLVDDGLRLLEGGLVGVGARPDTA